jgi:CBS domain-containing protein
MTSNVALPAAQMPESLSEELRRFAPFDRMAAADLQAFIARCAQRRYAAGETILRPDDGPVSRVLFLRRGNVAGGPSRGDPLGGGFLVEPGELFPVAAWLDRRAVSAPYRAADECYCLEVDADALRELAQRCRVLAEYLNGRAQHVMALSRESARTALASQALAEQSMEARLGSLLRRGPIACRAQDPLREVLQLMHDKRVGSVLVLDEGGAAEGIFTRHDVLERVALAQPPMDTPVGTLMTQPVHTLDIERSVQDAVLLMSRHGVRHVPVTERGRVVGMVSERDLFAMQRLSLRRLSVQLREAPDLQALVAQAPDIRRLARTLMAQGLSARSLTELVSQLNDALTQRAVQLAAQQLGLDLRRACWLAFGSEGRSEQTIATDQDNGLVFASGDPAADRPAWQALGRLVNDTLDACGYPLCKGGIMAREPDCCLSVDEWIARFGQWIDQGGPEELLKANIFFDFRPLAGELSLAAPMREFVLRRAAQMPRFARQMAQNALRNAPRLNWMGALDPQRDGDHEWIDLKLHGTMIFVDAARLYALAHGIDAVGTRARLEGVAGPLRVDDRECRTWIGAFEFLQMLRLRVQVQEGARSYEQNANLLDLRTLNAIDRRILKESFRAGQRLQQRLKLDYMR